VFLSSHKRVTHKRREPDETVRERWLRVSTFFVLDVSLTFLFFRRRSTSWELQLFGISGAGGIAHGWFTSGCADSRPQRESDSMEGARHVFRIHRARRATVERETERFRGRRPTFFQEHRRSCLRERFPNRFAGHAYRSSAPFFSRWREKRDRRNSSRRCPL